MSVVTPVVDRGAHHGRSMQWILARGGRRPSVIEIDTERLMSITTLHEIANAIRRAADALHGQRGYQPLRDRALLVGFAESPDEARELLIEVAALGVDIEVRS